jgi:hypothetical protein
MYIHGGHFLMRQTRFIWTISLLVLVTVLLGGCGILYTDIQVPRAYRSATPIDVTSKASDKIVTGEGCNQSVLFLVAWGNGGYNGAVRNALENEPPGSILYDVKIDQKAEIYLIGLYTHTCTVVTGKVSSP